MNSNVRTVNVIVTVVVTVSTDYYTPKKRQASCIVNRRDGLETH